MTKTKTFKVAGHVFCLEMKEDSPLWKGLSNYDPFEIPSSSTPEIFTLTVSDSLSVEGRQEMYKADTPPEEPRIDIYKTSDGYLFEMAPFGNMQIVGWLKTDEDFSHGTLKVDDNFNTSNPVRARNYGEFCVNNSMMLLYAFKTATMDTLEMHSSVTVNEGKGYLFLGKSGTGKSTHSGLWLKYVEGSRLLNDDNPVIRVEDGKVTVYGTPWSGKTPCYRNESVPVGAIVRIRQAPQNKITKLSLPEAFASISSSCSGLRSIKAIGDGLFKTAVAVASTVPCYVLDCLPDKDAAEVCHNAVASKNTEA